MKQANREQYYILLHRLCFLYYNIIGGAPMPSPLQYARKMTKFFADITAGKR